MNKTIILLFSSVSFSNHSWGEKQVALSQLWKVAMPVFLTPALKKRIHRGWRFTSVHFKQSSQLDKSCFSVWLNQACTDKLNQMLMWAWLPSETCRLWIVPLLAPTGPQDVLSLLRSLDVVKNSSSSATYTLFPQCVRTHDWWGHFKQS